MTAGIVPQLQGEFALEGLAVGDPRFGFDSGAPRSRLTTANLRVPGAQVALDREGNLGPPMDAWMEAIAQPLEQGELRAVADRVAARISLDDQIESNDGKPRSEVRERCTIDLAALEARELALRASQSGSRRAKAEPRSDSRLAVLISQSKHRAAHPAAPSIVGPFTSTHRHGAWPTGLIHGSPAPMSRDAGQGTDGRGSVRVYRAVAGQSSRNAGQVPVERLVDGPKGLTDRPLARQAGRA